MKVTLADLDTMALTGLEGNEGRARWRFRDATAGTEISGLEETLRAFLRPDLGMAVGGLITSCCFTRLLLQRKARVVVDI